MTSDLVAGLRRRPSVNALSAFATASDYKRIRQYNTDLGGTAVSIVVDCVTGVLRVVDELSGSTLYTTTSSYLVASAAKSIRAVTLNDEVYFCNVSVKPTLEDSPDKATFPDPIRWGYFFVATGAYSKRYDITMTDRVTGTTSTVTYTTPDGSAPAHVAQSTPEYIADQLRTLAAAAWVGMGATLYINGAYVAVQGGVAVQTTISTPSGAGYMRASNAMSIRDTAELPAVLPAEANGIIVAVGSTKEKSFYRYEHLRRVWTEDCDWSAMRRPASANMPSVLKYVGGVFSFTSPTWERRTSGDATSNPDLKFLTDGITGMCAFQGRLVFLSNEYVNMSASGEPLRWYRTTLSSLADNDPIEVAAQGALTAPYEWGVTFNKDLVLFGRRYQGVVPGAGVVTPRTAYISLMTKYDVDTAAQPSVAGRSIFFGSPRSLGYVGVHEMVPSQYTDTQYLADDVTSHIPRYVEGPWRFLVSSTTSNILVGGVEGDPRTLIIHEYLWNGAEKVHHAWHKWTFAHPVVDAYFSGDVLVCLFSAGAFVLHCRIDLQRGAGAASTQVPRLDFYVEATCTVAGQLTVPNLVQLLGPLFAFKTEGDDAYLGQAVQAVIPTGPNTTVTLLDAAIGDKFVVGVKFESSCTPSSPVIKDSKGVPITTSRAVLHRWAVSLAATGLFSYEVSDGVRTFPPFTTTPLRLFSQNLGAGVPLADTATVIIPGRVDMHSALLKLSTTDFYDMNVQGIEYGFRFTQRFRRS